jgi:hypothetical protein
VVVLRLWGVRGAREAREEGVEEGVEAIGVVDEEGVTDAIHFFVGAAFNLLLHLFDGA